MGYVVGAVLACAVVIYAVMKLWWLIAAGVLAWATWRWWHTTSAARRARELLIAQECAGLRERADAGHAAYLSGTLSPLDPGEH